MGRRLLAAYLAVLTVILAGAMAGGALLFRDLSSGDPIDAVANRNAYDVVGWELRHLPEKWLYKLATIFDGDRSEAEEDALLERYFQLAQDIRGLEREGPDAEGLKEAEAERLRIENDVEEILESRVSDFLRDQGLAMNPPLFSDIDMFFPPLDFEMDRTPRVLAVSPRERIELDRDYLLASGLDVAKIVSIESEAEAAGDGVSALVVGTAGVATYPSVVSELASYRSLLQTVIHEWLHQYLTFYPLGRSYFGGQDVRTLNETVANLAGDELADAFLQRYGAETDAGPPASRDDDGFDFRTEMRALRLRVDELLTEGRVTEAERLMREKRDEFEEHGFYIRRINQAYFAWHGSYADTPSSIDPIGPKLERLRERAGSVVEFVRLARGLTSEAELDALLAET